MPDDIFAQLEAADRTGHLLKRIWLMGGMKLDDFTEELEVAIKTVASATNTSAVTLLITIVATARAYNEPECSPATVPSLLADEAEQRLPGNSGPNSQEA